MQSAIRFLAFFSIFGLGAASAQLDRFTPPKPQPLWKADSLFIGASFTRASFAPVKVWLIGNEAGWEGNLYFIDPKTKQEVFLFTNHGTPNQVIVLSDKYDIPVGDTVYFVYRVVTPTSANGFPNDDSHLPKYTGPNVPGVSQFVSAPSSAKYGHRWSVAGRVNDTLVQFGFEDNVNPANSDYDYDDIIFGTTLSLAQNEVKASLAFTDKNGVALAPGAFWSPANDTVYISYSDDFLDGKLPADITLTVKNRNGNGTVTGDNETFSSLPATRNGTTGLWKVKVPIKEAPGGIPGDKILETYFLGEVTASVKSHSSLGVADGNTLTATLNIAYPDKPETVKILNCSDPASDITRLTTCVSVQVTDQNPTKLPKDTLYAEVRCDGSGDIIGKVMLLEQPDGTFKSGPLVKNEGAAVADGALSCMSTDNITVTYVDVIYGNRVTDKASWTPQGAEDFYYALAGDLNTKITQIKDGDAANFVAVIKTATPTVDVVDQIVVTLTTLQGEKETLTAVETGPNTGVFTVPVPFGFATTAPVPLDGKVTGFLDPTQAVASVTVHGVAVSGLKNFQSDITLKPALNVALRAYIKDQDGNGAGDHVYIVFTRPLEALPTSVTPVFWNGTAATANTGTPILTLMPGFPNVVVADFSASQFPVGATSILAGQVPTATLPSDNIFGGQKPAISDSMGPVLMTAEIKNFDNRTLTNGSTSLGVDTLNITVSEALKSQSNWQELLRFSKADAAGKCSDYANSKPVVPEGPVRDGADNSNFIVYVAKDKAAAPQAGDCIFLNVGGIYTDLANNLPTVYGIKLQGPPPSRLIQVFRGYPPVVGISASGDPIGFVLVNNDPRDDKGSIYSTNKGAVYQTEWVPPADFVPGVPYVGTKPVGGVQAPSVGSDLTIPGPMPANISTIQVISTGEYSADITIFDNLGNFMKHFTQSFGYHGELANVNRSAIGGLASYLVWDLKDSKGQIAGQGVYVWKVVFTFKNNKQEIRYTRTGVTRSLAISSTH